MRYTEAVYS